MVESQQLWGFFLSCQVPSDLLNLHDLLKDPFSNAVPLGHSLEGIHVPSLDHIQEGISFHRPGLR